MALAEIQSSGESHNQAARREARRLGKMIGYDNVAVIDYYTNDPLMVYRGR